MQINSILLHLYSVEAKYTAVLVTTNTVHAITKKEVILFVLFICSYILVQFNMRITRKGTGFITGKLIEQSSINSDMLMDM